MKLKKILAFCLALSLLLGMLPMTVFAENGEADGAEAPAGTVQESETSETGDEPLESGDPAMIDETPDSQTPAAGGQTPADGGQTPSEGGETPADGGQTPADGGREGQEAGDGGQTPSDGGQTPGEDGETPDEEGQQPAACEKCNTAHEGDCPAPEAGEGSTLEIPDWQLPGFEEEEPQLTTEELYEAMFQETTLRGLFNLVNENVDALVGFNIGQVYELEYLVAEIKSSTTMTQDEEEALKELLDNVGTLKDMLGYGTCEICSGTEGGHYSSCTYFGKRVPTSAITPFSNELVSGDLHYDKNLMKDESGNMAIQLEAWTEGNTVVIPTEVVVVLDHSASVYSPVDRSESGIWSYEQFIEKADKDKGSKYAGYYVAVNKYYGTDIAEDVKGNEIKTGDYVYALIRYNTELGKWERTHLIKFDKDQYTGNRINTSFFDDFPMRTQDELHALTRTDTDGKPLSHEWYGLESRGFQLDTARYFQTIYGATVDALIEFANIAKTIPECKIAFTGFAGRYSHGTGIFSSETLKLDRENSTTDAFFSASNTTALNTIIDNYIPHFGGTSTQDGLNRANEIFKANPTNGTTNRVVMLFTDGIPSDHNQDMYGKISHYDAAIKEGYITKNTYKATLYTVGPAQAVADAEGEQVNFLDYISSNYPLADSLENHGTAARNDCKMLANNGAELVAAFKTLGQLILNSSKVLNEKTQIKDVVTPYFQLGGSYGDGDIHVYKVPCTGVDKDGSAAFAENGWEDITSKVTLTQTSNEDGTTSVVVTGYDFEANSVFKDQKKGSKLVIQIPIQPKDIFLGGNHVPTNTSDSGLYDKDGNLVQKFPIPEADVITKASAEICADINVYLGSVFAEKIGTDGTKHYGLGVGDLHGVIRGGYNNVSLDFTKPYYGLDPAMDDYVDVTLDIYQPEEWYLGMDIDEVRWKEEPVLIMDEIRWDTPYKLKITISPTEEGTCETATAEDIGWIRVFYPEITFHDVRDFYYGELPDSDRIRAAEEGDGQTGITIGWINQSREGKIIYDEAVTMTMPADGKKPAVELSYNTPVGMQQLPKTDVAVEALVEKIGYLGKSNLALNQYVNFKWQECSPACQAEEKKIAAHQGNADSPEFYIHPQTCDLTITKTGGNSGEPYVFEIWKDGAKYTEVSITGNDSVTISELPIGSYEVKEKTEWSWRFAASSKWKYNNGTTAIKGAKFELKPNENEDDVTVTFTNSISKKQWFNDYSLVVENIFGQEKKVREVPKAG